MPRPRIIYESTESITGVLPRSKERIFYSTVLKIRDGGKLPVSLDLTFQQPQSFRILYASRKENSR